MTTKAEALAVRDLAAIRASRALRRNHAIVPVDVHEADWRTVGRCAVCDLPIMESGDYRTNRWRHNALLTKPRKSR